MHLRDARQNSPRLRESHAKRAAERIVPDDLRRADKLMARKLHDLLLVG